MLIYTVLPGDSIFSIANTYGSTTARIIWANQLKFPDRLVPGQALVIPDQAELHTVQTGDTLYSIANANMLSLQALRQQNGPLPALRPGMTVYIPHSPITSRDILVSGYCYPHISSDALHSTLPFLSMIDIFSYEVRPDGSLAPINDQRVIETALMQSVAPIMVLSNIDESGSFSSNLVATILGSPRLQQTVLDNAFAIMQQNGYVGLDVDFEYVPAASRDEYNAFLARAAELLHPAGFSLSTAVPAKTSANASGLLVEGSDYAAHGRIADRVLLMTYDWGYQYGPPMAVSPYQEVEAVLQYAITEIPPHKILMGVPNYAYDWELPHRPGNAATLLSNVGAVELAAAHWSEIHFDERSKTPYFGYLDTRGREHVVWFDDARSFEAKLSLVQEYQLGGIGYWNINTLFRQGWLVLASMYDVVHVV